MYAARNHHADAEKLHQQCACLVLGDARRRAAMWPPVMWPVSWAMTPITSLGVCACISVPVWMYTLRPSITKALKLSFDDAHLERPEPSPAAGKSAGVVREQVLDLGIADQRQVLRGRGRRPAWPRLARTEPTGPPFARWPRWN